MDLHEFENLNPEEQEKVFHKSSFKEKGELLMHSHNPAALTRSLSQEELFLVTRELDTEERGEIIRYATLPQLFFISDLECWKRDRYDGRGFLKWLEALLAAGDDKLLIWLSEMDFEAIIAGFQQVIQVMKPDHEWTADEVLGDAPYFSLDQMYYISVSEENLETIKRSLEVIFENRRGRYVAILEGVMGELNDQVEEEAYQRREIRLSERGFPDFETAHQIYRPLSRQEFENFPRKDSKEIEPRDLESATPNYMVMWSQERFFLDDVLHSYQNDRTGIRDKLQEELAWISNKVIACEGIDFSSEDRVRRGIERARAFINIGLEELSGRNIPGARKILQQRWLEVIFRWGASQTFNLRDEAKNFLKTYWKQEQVALLSFLDSPFDSLYAGLIRPIPECYDASVKRQEPLRDFRTLDDVERTGRGLQQLKAIHEVFLSKYHKEFLQVQTEAEIVDSQRTLFSFLGTLFAQFLLTHKAAYAPIDSKQFPALEKKFETNGSKKILQAETKQAFSQQLLGKNQQDICLPLFALFYSRFEERFSELIWVSDAKAKKKSARK